VSDLTSIAQGLRAMGEGIDRAQQAVAAANARAEEIAARAAMTGFVGISMGVQQVQLSIGEIRQRLMTLARSVEEAAGPVADASGGASPQETVALLNPASEHVSRVRDGVAGLVEQVTQVQQLTGAVLLGGQPGPMLAALDQVKQDLTGVIGQSDLTREAVAAAVAAAQGLGEQGN
jgi:hypothetical protein